MVKYVVTEEYLNEHVEGHDTAWSKLGEYSGFWKNPPRHQICDSSLCGDIGTDIIMCGAFCIGGNRYVSDEFEYQIFGDPGFVTMVIRKPIGSV